ncbi:MAG TPA: DegT/DnrJ/EryC1/StrS family aminotransferase [Candidatus Omnitrophota bacterium]|nr:DegT/DnrJ/EryC1/StrS family aminotransferase [Candidatus Omnitrophota bacterium]
MNVPFVDLNAQYREIRRDIKKPLENLFVKSSFILGEDVKLFEAEFARHCGTNYAIGLNSGTDALFLSLLSLGIKEGDEVIVPVFTFIATALAVSYTGAKPVFVDIDDKTYNIDPEKIRKAVTKNTKAIIPVHLFGQSADMQPISAIAKEYNLKVVEDAAQAHGALYQGKQCGSLADIGCFSFYPTKNLGAFGDAGMVVTDSEKIYQKIFMLRDCGRKGRYEHAIKGYNSRLDTIQAIILRAKLTKLDKWNKLRQENAKYYSQLLKDEKNITLPQSAKDASHVYHIYAVRIKDRDRIYEELRQKGIGVSIYYPMPLHLQEAYKELNYKKGDFPVAERVCQEIIALPMYPHMNKKQIKFVSEQLKKVLNG